MLAWQDIGESAAVSLPQPWDAGSNPISLAACDKTGFQLWHAAPLWNDTVALLGDLSKVVPPSADRFLDVEVNVDGPTSVRVVTNIAGAPQEKVNIAFYNAVAARIETVACTIPTSGRATVAWPDNTCA
jgi:hypothetical protein